MDVRARSDFSTLDGATVPEAVFRAAADGADDARDDALDPWAAPEAPTLKRPPARAAGGGPALPDAPDLGDATEEVPTVIPLTEVIGRAGPAARRAAAPLAVPAASAPTTSRTSAGPLRGALAGPRAAVVPGGLPPLPRPLRGSVPPPVGEAAPRAGAAPAAPTAPAPRAAGASDRSARVRAGQGAAWPAPAGLPPPRRGGAARGEARAAPPPMVMAAGSGPQGAHPSGVSRAGAGPIAPGAAPPAAPPRTAPDGGSAAIAPGGASLAQGAQVARRWGRGAPMISGPPPGPAVAAATRSAPAAAPTAPGGAAGPGSTAVAPGATLATPAGLASQSATAAAAGPARAPWVRSRSASRPRPIAWGRVAVAAAILAGVVGGATARWAVDRSPPAAAGPPIPTVVGVLPFAGPPELAGALGRAVAAELAAIAALPVLRVEPVARAPGWQALEARARGATAIVRGAVARVDGEAGADRDPVVQIRIEIERRDARPITVVERAVRAVDAVAAIRGAARAFAGALVEPSDVPDQLARARAALLADRPGDAHRHLGTVLLHDPGHREARYVRALAAAWAAPGAGAGVATLAQAVDAALAVAPTPEQERVLRAYRALGEGRLVDALGQLARLTAELAPGADPVDALAGQLAAELAAGRAAGARVTAARLAAVAPGAQLGGRHLLAHALAHGDALAPGAAGWLRAAGAPGLARAHLAGGDAAGAATVLGPSAGTGREAALARAHVELMSGRAARLGAALAPLADVAPALHLAHRLALAHARGDAGERARALAPAALAALAGADAALALELVPLAIAVGDPELRDRVIRALDAPAGDPLTARRQRVARALLGEVVGSPDPEDPEIDAIARAVAAERAGDGHAAAPAWRAAARAAQDPSARALAAQGIARALRGAGDLEGAAAACSEVIAPRYFDARWGLLLGDCYAWTAEAAIDRGDRAAALAAMARLEALRAPAGPGDRVLRRGRAALVE